MSHISHVYHIVFRTKYSENVIPFEHEQKLYAYLYGISKEQGGYTYRIGGMPNHIHILCSIPSTIQVSKFIMNLKRSSSLYLSSSEVSPFFPNFKGWAAKFGSFTRCTSSIEQQIQYIKSQKEHHKHNSFEEEYIALLREARVEFDERYLFVD